MGHTRRLRKLQGQKRGKPKHRSLRGALEAELKTESNAERDDLARRLAAATLNATQYRKAWEAEKLTAEANYEYWQKAHNRVKTARCSGFRRGVSVGAFLGAIMYALLQGAIDWVALW